MYMYSWSVCSLVPVVISHLFRDTLPFRQFKQIRLSLWICFHFYTFWGVKLTNFRRFAIKPNQQYTKKKIKKWYSVVNKSAMHPPALGRLLQKYLDCCGLFQILSTENYMLVIIKAKRCKILWLSFKRTLLMNWFTLDKESDLLKKVKSCAKLKEISSPVVYAFPLLV